MRAPLSFLLVLCASSAVAQDFPVPGPRDVARALDTAIKQLVERQEDYQADPAVGRLPEGELSKWQDRERERLKKARGEDPSEWPYEGVYRVGRERSIPSGYRVGGTSITSISLLEAPGWKKDKKRRQAVERALEYVLDAVENDSQLAAGPKRGYDVRGWGHAYALRFLLVAKSKDAVPEELTEKVDAMLPHLIDCIKTNAQARGGWNYANDSSMSPFMTGSTLITLYMAKDAGLEVDEEMVNRALRALAKGKTSSGSYAYSGTARGPVDFAGSSARSSVAELSLYLAGESDVDELRRAVMGFFDGWEHLLDRKSKQGTHEGPYGIAPYYFFFGHTYAALAIEELPEAERPELRQRMLGLLWETREEDGTWNDRIFPRTSSYSTSMSVIAILAPEIESFPRWQEDG